MLRLVGLRLHYLQLLFQDQMWIFIVYTVIVNAITSLLKTDLSVGLESRVMSCAVSILFCVSITVSVSVTVTGCVTLSHNN